MVGGIKMTSIKPMNNVLIQINTEPDVRYEGDVIIYDHSLVEMVLKKRGHKGEWSDYTTYKKRSTHLSNVMIEEKQIGVVDEPAPKPVELEKGKGETVSGARPGVTTTASLPKALLGNNV